MKSTFQVKAYATGMATVTKSESGGPFEISGYATIWGNVDHGGDRAIKGSWAKSIKKRPVLPILWAHDIKSLPLGKTLMIAEDARGVIFSGAIASTSMGSDVAKVVTMGALTGVSYGFNPTKTSPARVPGVEGEVRDLLEQDVMEISLCNFPMNPKARLVTTSSQMISDAAMVARIDQRLAKGEKLENLTHKERGQYFQAVGRELERMEWDGKTRREVKYKIAYELQEAMKEFNETHFGSEWKADILSEIDDLKRGLARLDPDNPWAGFP